MACRLPGTAASGEEPITKLSKSLVLFEGLACHFVSPAYANQN